MPDRPADQLSMEELLRANIQHPEFQSAPQAPAAVPGHPDSYAQMWNEQFKSGQPAPPEAPAPPAEQPSAAPPQAVEPQVPRDDKGRFTKLYAGKYRSPEDLENAYLSQFQETQRIIQERDAIKAAQVLFNNQQQFRSREERQEPIKVNVPQEGEPFINPQQLDAYVEQRARQVASQQIQDTLGPILRSNQALNTIRNTYPEYQHNESDFTKWLTVNPELAGKIAESPEMGTEYAYLKFLREKSATLSQQAQAQAAQAQPQVDMARQHAAPPNTARNEVSDVAARNKVLQELYEHGRNTGEWGPYQKFRLTEAIPNWHFNTEWGKK